MVEVEEYPEVKGLKVKSFTVFSYGNFEKAVIEFENGRWIEIEAEKLDIHGTAFEPR